MDKAGLSEQEIRTRFITPAILKAGWSLAQLREEVSFTKGRITVRGRLIGRGKAKCADFLCATVCATEEAA